MTQNHRRRQVNRNIDTRKTFVKIERDPASANPYQRPTII